MKQLKTKNAVGIVTVIFTCFAFKAKAQTMSTYVHAYLSNPGSIVVDSIGNLYVANYGNGTVNIDNLQLIIDISVTID